MTRHRWSVTYELVTPESAEHGDAEKRGFLSQNVTLRDAIDEATEIDFGHCEASSSGDLTAWDWFTFYPSSENHPDGWESRSIHPPKSITSASMGRVARLLGAYR